MRSSYRRVTIGAIALTNRKPPRLTLPRSGLVQYALCGPQNYVASSGQPPLNHWSDRTERHITSQLECAQERHQGRIIPPTTRWFIGLDNFTLGQSLSFHLQIHLCVDVGRVERYMPEPGANSIDIHASAEQVCGCRVANRVGADSFFRQGGHLDLSFADISFDQRVDSESCYGMTAAIEKDTCGRRAARDENFEFINRTPPQRTLPLFSALAPDLYGTTSQVQFAHEQLCGFLGTSPGVVEK